MIDCKQKTLDLPFQIKFPWFKVPISTTVQVDITEKQKDFLSCAYFAYQHFIYPSEYKC